MATRAGDDADDIIRGTPENDGLAGGGGADRIEGGLGDDQIDGGDGGDSLDGGPDDDILFGGPGDDTLVDGSHNDMLYGGLGDDLLEAGQGSDLLDGGAGEDTLRGGADYDTLAGGEDDDVLEAGPSGSALNGGPGDDRMIGGIGSDGLQSEGDDADVFVVRAGDGDFGFDNIAGFNGAGDAGGDVLRLEGFDEDGVTITEHFGFPGPIIFDRPVQGPEAGQDASAPGGGGQSGDAGLDDMFGGIPPSQLYTTITTDRGQITIDAIGLVEGVDYFFA